MKSSPKIILYIFCLTSIFFGCTKDSIRKTYDKPEITIRANDPRITGNTIHFVKDTVYILSTNITRYSGQIFKIDAGTLIKVNDGISITINPGASIEAEGTASQPVVFTSSATKGSAGLVQFSTSTEHSWVGISIYGNYPTSDSSSGILSYVRIEFAAGSVINNVNFLPALVLTNIGKRTVINNVQVSYAVAQNSFLISGGAFDAKNLVSYASGSSDFLITDGYAGMLQNLFAYRHPFFSPSLGSGTSTAGLLISGFGTSPVISNMTVLGPGIQNGINQKYFDTTSSGLFGSINGSIVAALAITGGNLNIRNSLFMGFPKTGFYLSDYNTAAALLGNTADFKYNILECDDVNRSFYIEPNTYPPYTSEDFKDFMLQQNFHNQLFFDAAQLMLTDPYNYDVDPNPFPKSNSLVLNGANFSGSVFSNSFFDKKSYIGALSNDNNWLKGWTNFLPLQTNYNN